MRLRPALVLWHRWFGLLGALWLFLLGATGSVLVFYEEIDHGLNADWFTASPGSSLPVSRMVGAALEAHPGNRPGYIDLPDEPGDVVTVYLEPVATPGKPPVASPSYWQVFVDPATARVLGARDANAIDLSRRGLMSFLYTFHYSLHLGRRMTWLLGLVGVVWIIDHVVSAVLSFPSAARWKESFRIRRRAAGHKRVFDLHRAGGLWLFPLTLTLAVTGVYFNWYETVIAAVDRVSPLTERPDAAVPALTTPLENPPVGLDQALALAGAARVDSLSYNPAKGVYWLRLFDPRDIDSNGGRWLFVDARSGAVVGDRHMNEGSAGDIFVAWQFPLHSGKAFGWPGRIAIFLAGIALCTFVVTGLMIWWRKRSARREAGRRSGVRPAPSVAPAE
ncbi:PepSY-associated TM helix domain-containing protein [Blastomonas sp.]|uniref:PepSY-associated TM helix domain-containing protein n=1 Tax=Blastomonas sp. TaxID=1909299 RepID=UPI00406A21F8